MQYVKYTLQLTNGKTVELARSYHNATHFRSTMPMRAELRGNSMVRFVVANWCTKDEKYRVWRRNDHAAYEPLVDTLEEAWIRK